MATPYARKHLITFVGTGNYQEATYRFPGGREHRAVYFASCAAQAYEVDVVSALATEEAHAKHGASLEEACKAPGRRFACHRISDGRTPEELWEVFTALLEVVEEGDRLVIDFTHALRSIPLIGAAAAHLVGLTRDAHVEAFLYGAYELRGPDAVSPVVDLSPFLQLMQWQSACQEFAHTGIARGLESARKAHPGEQLGAVANRADDLAQALAAMNPPEVVAAIQALGRAVEALDQKPSGPSIPPVAAPTRTVAQWMLSHLGGDLALDHADPEDRLRQEAALVHWYFDRGHYAQAIQLLREWVVSKVIVALVKEYRLGKAARAPFEAALNECVEECRPGTSLAKLDWVQGLRALEAGQCLIELFAGVRDIRNSIAHCAMTDAWTAPSKLRGKLEPLVGRLQELCPPAQGSHPTRGSQA